MNKNSFFSDLLQNIGFISAIAVAISQYALNDTFGIFFLKNSALYRASSFVALVISIGVILGIFVFRYTLLNKIYLPLPGKKRYFDKLDEINKEKNKILKEKGEEAAVAYQNSVIYPREPFGLQAIHIGFLSLFLALIAFILLVIQNVIWVTVLCFVAFIVLVVASISIFSIQLFRDNEYKKKKDEVNELLNIKITEFFSDKVTVISDYQDTTNFMNPIRTLIIEHPSRGLYRVDCNANDPSRLFNIQKIEVTKK